MNKVAIRPVALEKVESLIRKPILFDWEENEYKTPKLKSVIGTHGTQIDSIVNLAVCGRFVNGNPDLIGHFFLSANRDYADWDKTDLTEKLKDYAECNAFLKAIEYSESSLRHEDGELVATTHNDEGVVITFGKSALNKGVELHPSAEMEAELVLPVAPSIDTIRGIYPVENIAAKSLIKALTRLKNS